MDLVSGQEMIEAKPSISSKWNLRRQTLTVIVISILLLVSMIVSGFLIGNEKLAVNLEVRNSSPSYEHPFGTDWLGRDMLARTLKGLTLSFGVGLLTAFLSTLIALSFSLLSSWNKKIDYGVTWLIDLFISMPHIVTLLLISFAIGGGFKGVVVGIALTHWPSLTRLLRAEVMKVKTEQYIGVSRQLGKSRWWVAWNHYMPHLLPQVMIGFILLFPHTILHEAAITFLGFGLSPEQPAIGIILSEAMRYLSTGMWWLAFFPGLSLVIMVGIFDLLGNSLRKLIDPFHGQR